MKTILIAGRKGGVGKTTIAVTLADGLARRGQSVLLVDTDPQGHCAESFGIAERDSLYNLLIGGAAWASELLPAGGTEIVQQGGELMLLRSSDRTSRIVAEIGEDGALAFVDLLHTINAGLLQAGRGIDTVVIDTAPTTSMLDALIWLAADYHLYVTRLARLSFDGLMKVSEQADRFSAMRRQYLGQQTRLLGIVPNQMNAKTTLHRHNISELDAAYPGLVWTPITQRTAWEEATSFGQSIFEYAPTSQAARDGAELVDRVLRETGVSNA